MGLPSCVVAHRVRKGVDEVGADEAGSGSVTVRGQGCRKPGADLPRPHVPVEARVVLQLEAVDRTPGSASFDTVTWRLAFRHGHRGRRRQVEERRDGGKCRGARGRRGVVDLIEHLDLPLNATRVADPGVRRRSSERGSAIRSGCPRHRRSRPRVSSAGCSVAHVAAVPPFLHRRGPRPWRCSWRFHRAPERPAVMPAG